jgi:hypothetical protein
MDRRLDGASLEVLFTSVTDRNCHFRDSTLLQVFRTPTYLRDVQPLTRVTKFSLSKLRVDCAEAPAGTSAQYIAAGFLLERSSGAVELFRLLLTLPSGHGVRRSDQSYVRYRTDVGSKSE